jgi:hypothetical protein
MKTGITRGRVDGIGTYMGVAPACHIVPLKNPSEQISDFGDSGAVWYDPTTLNAVALHCKGARPEERDQFAIGTLMEAVCYELRVAHWVPQPRIRRGLAEGIAPHFAEV